jgi:hypothetical protein
MWVRKAIQSQTRLQKRRRRWRQALRTQLEFQVENQANGKLVPKLRYLALAPDSKWGSNYSCVYTFRVLGGDGTREGNLEAAIVYDFV